MIVPDHERDVPARYRAVRAACLLLLLAVVVTGLVLRTTDLHGSLWMDELHTSWVVANGWPPVAQRAAWGNQPPLFFWLVAAVTGLLGHAEWTLRLLSVVAGTGLIVASYVAVRVLSGSAAAGLLAAVLAALDRTAVFYSQEARPYALLQCGAVIHVLLLALVCRRPTLARRAAWIVLGILLWYCHYTYGLMVVAQWVGFAVWQIPRRRHPLADAAGTSGVAHPATAAGSDAPRRYGLRSLGCDTVLLALAAAPSLPHVREIARYAWQWEAVIPPPAPADLLGVHPAMAYLAAPAALALLYACLRHATMHPDAARAPLPPSDPAGGAGCRPAPWRACAYLLVCYAVPVMAAYTAAYATGSRVFYARYLLPAAAILPLASASLVAAAATGRRPHGQRGAAAGRWACRLAPWLAATGVVMLTAARGASVLPELYRWLAASDGRATLSLHPTGDYRQALAWVRWQAAGTRQPVFLATGLVETQRLATADHAQRAALADYLLFAVRGLYGLEDGRPLEVLRHAPEGWFTPKQLQLLRRHGGGWCVADCVGPSSDDDAQPMTGGMFPSDQQFRRALRSQAAHAGMALEVSLSGVFRGVYVYRLAVR